MFKLIEIIQKKRNINKVKKLLNAQTIDWDVVKKLEHWGVDKYQIKKVRKQTTPVTGETINIEAIVVRNYEYNHTFVVLQTHHLEWMIDDTTCVGSRVLIGELVITHDITLTKVYSFDDGGVFDLINIEGTDKYIFKLMGVDAQCQYVVVNLQPTHKQDKLSGHKFNKNRVVLFDKSPVGNATVKRYVVYDYDIDPNMDGSSVDKLSFLYVDNSVTRHSVVVIPKYTEPHSLTLDTFKQAVDLTSGSGTFLSYDKLKQSISKSSTANMCY